MNKDYLARIRTEDINPIVREMMSGFFTRLKIKQGLEGIVELGGLGVRNFSDVHSDVDASIFVSEPKPWLPLFEFYVPTPETSLFENIDFFEINVHQNTLQRERAREEWEEGKKEAYEEGRIIYDANGNVASLIRERVKFDELSSSKRMQVIRSAIASFNMTWNPLNDHLAVNKMLNQVVEIMYLANNEFRPHKKWRLEKARYLQNIPGNFDELIGDAYLVKEMSSRDVIRRISSVRSILDFYREAINQSSLDAFILDESVYDSQISSASAFSASAFSASAVNISAVKTSAVDIGAERKYSLQDQKMMLALASGQLYWLVDVNPMRQVARGFVYNSHDLINEGVALALETRRIMKGKMIRQNLEALNVIHPGVEYDEKQYDLIEQFECDDASMNSVQSLSSALLVSDFTEETVKKRVEALQRITKPLQRQLISSGLVPEDSYHFAVANCYFDRQLLNVTYSDRICPKDIPDYDRKLCQGFISYHLVGSNDELRQALREPIQGVYSEKHLEKIKSILGGIL